MKYGFGVDVGGTTVKLGLLSEAGELLEKWELPSRTENGGENILPDIARSVQGPPRTFAGRLPRPRHRRARPGGRLRHGQPLREPELGRVQPA